MCVYTGILSLRGGGDIYEKITSDVEIFICIRKIATCIPKSRPQIQGYTIFLTEREWKHLEESKV